MDHALNGFMDLDGSTRDRLIDLLQRNLAALYEAEKEKKKEWEEAEDQRKDAVQTQDAIEEEQRLIANQIAECKDLLKSLNET